MPGPIRRAVRAVGVGFVRSASFCGTAVIVPATGALLPVLAELRIVGSPWSWSNPWSWFGLAVIVAATVTALAHPVAVLFRRMLARWSGLRLESGYRVFPEPVRLSTGFWWNGVSYERSREHAEHDLIWRRMFEPAFRREVRWVLLAAAFIAPACGLPLAAVAAAALRLEFGTVSGVVEAIVLLIVAVVTAPVAWRLVQPLALQWLAPSETSMLSVADLLAQRADLTAAHDAEIRRIERDLHDGAQSRLTAIGLDLAAAERLMDTDPARARELLRSGRLGTAKSLTELRELVHGVYPPVLIERGLIPAIEAMALDSPVSTVVDALPDPPRLSSPIEAAVYFAVAELLTNIAHHTSATQAEIRIRTGATSLEIVVADDGPGGAAVRPGGGLDGIRRRLAAFEGVLEVDSPAGGPTRMRVSVPCG